MRVSRFWPEVTDHKLFLKCDGPGDDLAVNGLQCLVINRPWIEACYFRHDLRLSGRIIIVCAIGMLDSANLSRMLYTFIQKLDNL